MNANNPARSMDRRDEMILAIYALFVPAVSLAMVVFKY